MILGRIKTTDGSKSTQDKRHGRIHIFVDIHLVVIMFCMHFPMIADENLSAIFI